MGPFFQKDLLVFWRDRKEILIALLLPIVIIFVLNVAFSGLFKKDSSMETIHVGIVQEENAEIGMQQFTNHVQELNIPVSEKEVMLTQAENIQPISLIEQLLNGPELQEWVDTKQLSEAEAKELVEAGELDAIIKIPSGFTNSVLSSILLGKESAVPLAILAEKESAALSALEEIVSIYMDSLNMEFALGGVEVTEVNMPQGGVETVEGKETYNISQYFTIAISTLFALFIAQTVAIKTSTEKRERVFNRIILTDRNPIHYLLGKTTATFILSWLQVMITITLSQLILDVFPGKSLEFWVGLILANTIFALAIAGLSAVFTGITLNLEDANAASGIFTLITMGFGVLGGSFFPLQALPEFMQKIGEWTPNGLTQTLLVQWIQYSNLQDIIMPLFFLALFFVICMMIAFFIFPRRGRA